MTNGNDLAHPTNIIDPERQFAPEYHTGLTKREYFAAMALQGILANSEIAKGISNNIPADKSFSFTCSQSVELADALIKALNEPSNP